LINTKILIKKNNSEFGMGMIGELNKELDELHFLNYLKEKMNVKIIKHSPLLNKKIKKVAVLGGSGSFAIEDALNNGADCLVTADLKYHDYFKAENKILLVDIGHYESEQYTKDLILNLLNKKIPKFACIISKSNTNPVNYF
jgi:putative NIF3 family GTP cyclohydrolase 1 type 2